MYINKYIYFYNIIYMYVYASVSNICTYNLII